MSADTPTRRWRVPDTRQRCAVTDDTAYDTIVIDVPPERTMLAPVVDGVPDFVQREYTQPYYFPPTTVRFSTSSWATA